MTQTTIKIGGKDVGVAYSFATEVGFWKLASCNIQELDINNPEHLLYLVLSAILAYYNARGEESPINDDYLLYHARMDELVSAAVAIHQLRKEWSAMPDAEPEDKPEEPEKNS